MMSKTKETQTDAPKFSIDKLRENCKKLFGVSASTFAGATHNMEGKEFTVDEMKKIISDWQGKEVK